MASMNMVILIGHLGHDPKVNLTQSGKAVANLSVATSMRVKGEDGQYADKTEWHRVTAWDKTAEYCLDYLHKGSCVSIEGRLQTRKWQDKDGQDRYSTEVIANRVQSLDKRDASQSDGQSDGQSHEPVQTPVGNVREAFEMDDVPFS